MSWIINALSCIILTSLTGSVLFIGWFGLGKLIERRGYINIMYPMLRSVMCFFIIPVVYLILLISTRRGMFGGDLFLHTAGLFAIGRVVHYIWFLSIVFTFGFFLYDLIKMVRAYRTAFECDVEVQNYFSVVCEELGVPEKKLALLQSYQAKVPFIKGLFHPTVIIPVGEYTEHELRVIFIHEINHYRQKDMKVTLVR